MVSAQDSSLEVAKRLWIGYFQDVRTGVRRIRDRIVRRAGDEEVRRRYQVWIFYYPTSLPVAYSTMLLREDLEAFVHRLDPNGTKPALHRAVLVGHSMGGLLCRFAISDGGDRYYHHFFREPVDHLRLSAFDRRLVRRAFYYSACPDVARVVFIATPHRGCRLAGGMLGNVGRLLLHMPSPVQQRLRNILVSNHAALTIKNHLRPGSSLDSLTPRSPVIAAINDLVMSPGVRLHSIVGDRGHGGPPEQSSDGVVPYESSHLPQAESERVVPAGHTGTPNVRKRRQNWSVSCTEVHNAAGGTQLVIGHKPAKD